LVEAAPWDANAVDAAMMLPLAVAFAWERSVDDDAQLAPVGLEALVAEALRCAPMALVVALGAAVVFAFPVPTALVVEPAEVGVGKAASALLPVDRPPLSPPPPPPTPPTTGKYGRYSTAAPPVVAAVEAMPSFAPALSLRAAVELTSRVTENEPGGGTVTPAPLPALPFVPRRAAVEAVRVVTAVRAFVPLLLWLLPLALRVAGRGGRRDASAPLPPVVVVWVVSVGTVEFCAEAVWAVAAMGVVGAEVATGDETVAAASIGVSASPSSHEESSSAAGSCARGVSRRLRALGPAADGNGS
jgi:hypothetical protein